MPAELREDDDLLAQLRDVPPEIKLGLPHLDVMTLEKHIDHCRARQDKAAFRAIFRLLQEATRQP